MTEPMTDERRAWYEKLVHDCIHGRAIGGDGVMKPEKARDIVEMRWNACIRVTGQTPPALAQNDRDRYDQWLRGTHGALLRESLQMSGELSRKHLQRLWRREQERRMGRDVAELHGMFDGPEDGGIE